MQSISRRLYLREKVTISHIVTWPSTQILLQIEPLRFSNKEEVLGMLTKVEELYADSFGESCPLMRCEVAERFLTEKGSLRRARERLHSTPPATTHHSSTWRSGIFLGLALPAIVIGIRQGDFHITA